MWRVGVDSGGTFTDICLGPGQSVAIITPGAGGYGDPRERDRALVRRDLDEGVISDAVARDAYGFEP